MTQTKAAYWAQKLFSLVYVISVIAFVATFMTHIVWFASMARSHEHNIHFAVFAIGLAAAILESFLWMRTYSIVRQLFLEKDWKHLTRRLGILFLFLFSTQLVGALSELDAKLSSNDFSFKMEKTVSFTMPQTLGPIEIYEKVEEVNLAEEPKVKSLIDLNDGQSDFLFPKTSGSATLLVGLLLLLYSQNLIQKERLEAEMEKVV